ncbi:MAG: aldehyde dehydrogenase (NADP(+)) [Verrucomicrobia bacterium]|nr:aldehyde dehydrogenase (NADP(+)) [Verrucomicrobiota bacterium]
MSTTPHTITAPILIDGQWRQATLNETFSAMNPATGNALSDVFPVSAWADLDAALESAAAAFVEMRNMTPQKLASFIRQYADAIETHSESICQAAALETGLPFAPRLKEVELPRTTGQLRQAAQAAEDGAWRLPTLDRANNIRSVLEPLGPVAVFGPNNFPLAFNGICGGDFAAAIAAGNPVIAKAHRSHPMTSRLLAECARDAAIATGMPPGIVQMVYATSRADGLKLVSDARLGAAAFTGSRSAGMALKSAAGAVGKPIYLEMSSVNPVVILPGALEERFDKTVTELVTSALMGAGQFCTNPGIVIVQSGATTERFITALAEKYAATPCGTLLGKGVVEGLQAGIPIVTSAGATPVAGGGKAEREGCAWSNTLLRVSGGPFIDAPEALQTELFGNATLIVVADDVAQMAAIIDTLEGNLTGCIYSALDGRDDDAYALIAPGLRIRVGRLINDKMPTGVAVSPAMNHGGPFPASGHPHFTAVGIPAALRRFSMLACYDGVRQNRLPEILRDKT